MPTGTVKWFSDDKGYDSEASHRGPKAVNVRPLG
jgi:cold shock CspA family protein